MTVATGEGWELRLGDCLDDDGLPSFANGSFAAIITDPPYSERTHKGQRHGRRDPGYKDGWVTSVGLEYEFLKPDEQKRLCVEITRTRARWALIMTSHDLFPGWDDSLGGYTFPPIPIVLDGMNVRLAGDGPSSWTVWMVVNRATGVKDGTKPGAYVGSPGRGPERAANPVKGHKPLWLMERLILDYTKPGDLVCDPYAGSGTTGEACIKYGRRFIGWERKLEHFEFAVARLRGAREQKTMFLEEES